MSVSSPVYAGLKGVRQQTGPKSCDAEAKGTPAILLGRSKQQAWRIGPLTKVYAGGST